MVVGFARVELWMPANASLKDRRRVVRSLVDRGRRRFNAAMAEVDDGKDWQRATIGVACVAPVAAAAEAALQRIIAWIDDETDGQLVEYEAQVI